MVSIPTLLFPPCRSRGAELTSRWVNVYPRVFLDHYHLREQPFGVTPDPRFFFDTPSHREAWSSLQYGIETRRGFLGLVAPPGMGKTTLLFRLMEKMRERARTAFLFQTQCDPDEFLCMLMADLEEKPHATSNVVRPSARATASRLIAGEDWGELAERACKLAHGDGAAIAFRENNELICVASTGEAPSIGMRTSLHAGLSGACFRTGEIISCENVREDQRISSEVRETEAYGSILIAPIRVAECTVGVAEVFSQHHSTFGVVERAALTEVVEEIGSRARSSLSPTPRGPFVAKAPNRAALHEAIYEVLIREAEKGAPPILVVDEAQNLSDAVLETIRLLSNFETPRTKLLQVVLAGQTELRERLAQPHLRQLRQRISIMSALEPLNRRQVGEYIAHRLRIAGHNGHPLFTPEACDYIASLSLGVPREINNICFHAMSLGCATAKIVIDVPILREVASDLRGSKPVKTEPGDDSGCHDAILSSQYLSSPQRENSPEARLPPEPPHAPHSTSTTRTISEQRMQPRDGKILPSSKQAVNHKGSKRRAPRRIYYALALASLTLLSSVLVWPRISNTTERWIAKRIASPATGSESLGYGGARTAESFSNAQARDRKSAARWSASAHDAATGSALKGAGPAHGGIPDQHLNLTADPGSGTSPEQQAASQSEVSHDASTELTAVPNGEGQALAAGSGTGTAAAPMPLQPRTDTPADLPPPIGLVTESENKIVTAVLSTGVPVVPSAAASDSRRIETATDPSVARNRSTAMATTTPDTIPASLVTMVKPVYPEVALRGRIQGQVVVTVTITKDGRVEDVRVIRGHPALVGAAVAAVRQWRYQPCLIDGEPQQVRTDIIVNFRLEGRG